jgi:predicted metal-dependent phosphoesterase TrpH
VTRAGRGGGGRLLVDLHNHTIHSYDARNRPDDYRRGYEAGRFDVVAITDHNTIAGALELREAAPFPVIVGQEIDTADGELIGLFLTEPVPARLAAIETAERIRAQGGLVYLQHPFYRIVRGRLQPPAREALRGRRLIDIVESRNGGPFAASANVRALAWARACGLPHAAASDAHVPAAIGSCLTSIPDGPVDPASLPGRLRMGADIDRRSPAPVAIGRIAAARAQTAFRVMTGTEPPRRRRP